MANESTLTVRILGNAKQAIGEIDGVVGKLGNLGAVAGGAALAGGAAVGALLVKGTLDAINQEQIVDSMSAQLGLVGAEAERFGSVAGDLYADAYGDSFAGATEQLTGILRTFGTDISEAEAFGLSANSIDITSAFGLDPERLQQTAGGLLRNGLAGTATEAFDIVTAGLQGINAPAGDVLDTLYEFAEPLASLGLEGGAAIGVLSAAADAGVFDLTKAGDAIKELSIRAIDGSTATSDAYMALGLDAEAMAAAIAAGGPAAQQATSDIIRALAAIEDPLAADAAGVALFGTTWEDLGPQAIAALDPMAAGIAEVDGAAAMLGDTLNDNVGTRFEAIKRQALQGVTEFAGDFVLPLLEDLMPTLETVGQGITGLFAAFSGEGVTSNGFVGFMERVGVVARQVVDAIVEAWPSIQATIVTVFEAVSSWLETNWPPIQSLILDVFEAVSTWVMENWPQIQATILAAVDAVMAGIDRFVVIVSALWDEFGDDILQIITDVWPKIEQIVSGALTVVQGIFEAFSALFSGDWSALWGSLGDIFTGLWDIASGIITGAFDILKGSIEGILEAISGSISGTWDSVVETVGGLGGRIADAAVGIFDGVTDAFKSAINTVIRGWNNLSFSVPEIDFGPLGSVGGQTVSTPNIPELATGGVLDRPTLFLGGEYPGAASNREIVTPEALMASVFRTELDRAGGAGPAINIEQVVVPSGVDILDELGTYRTLAGAA